MGPKLPAAPFQSTRFRGEMAPKTLAQGLDGLGNWQLSMFTCRQGDVSWRNAKAPAGASGEVRNTLWASVPKPWGSGMLWKASLNLKKIIVIICNLEQGRVHSVIECMLSGVQSSVPSKKKNLLLWFFTKWCQISSQWKCNQSPQKEDQISEWYQEERGTGW